MASAVREGRPARVRRDDLREGELSALAAAAVANRLERALDELGLDLVTFSRLGEIVCPEQYHDSADPAPTAELPRTDGRLDVLIERAEAGVAVTHAADADLPDELANLARFQCGNGNLLAGQHQGRQMTAGEAVTVVDLREGRIGGDGRVRGVRLGLRGAGGQGLPAKVKVPVGESRLDEADGAADPEEGGPP